MTFNEEPSTSFFYKEPSTCTKLDNRLFCKIEALLSSTVVSVCYELCEQIKSLRMCPLFPSQKHTLFYNFN